MNLFFISLGCDKNKVDSEKVLGFFLSKNNIRVVDNPNKADIVIINTCSFIKDAKIESISTIKYFSDLKMKGKIKMLMVIGCLAEELTKNDSIKNLFNNVDIVLPLNKYLDGLNTISDRALDILSFSSSVKICEGCNKFCSYCIIPYLRGRFRSRKIEEVYDECTKLAKKGVKELNIVGQDVLSYGKDNYGHKNIRELIDKIALINGIKWIRLLYCYPEEIDEDVINLVKQNPKVLHYIDMPIQHISNKILKSMNRKTTKESIINSIYYLRNNINDIVIRTTVMVGFPGETNEDFEELCEFIKKMKFDKLGVFKYSDENLARSYNFKNKISDEIKLKRLKKIMDVQQKVIKEENVKKIGKTYNSLVEGYDVKRKFYIVRPYFNARDIDDKVYVKTKETLISGSFVDVKLIKMQGMDFIGEIK